MQLTTVGREVWQGVKKAEAFIEAGVGDRSYGSRLLAKAQTDRGLRERPYRGLNGLVPLEYLAMIQRESVPGESQVC